MYDEEDDNNSIEDMNRAFYDDGQFEDSGVNRTRRNRIHKNSSSFYIPTYDELDLEGRYYTYGSREDYNEWRREEYRKSHNSSSRSIQSEGNGISTLSSVVSIVIFLLIIVLLVMSMLYG